MADLTNILIEHVRGGQVRPYGPMEYEYFVTVTSNGWTGDSNELVAVKWDTEVAKIQLRGVLPRQCTDGAWTALTEGETAPWYATTLKVFELVAPGRWHVVTFREYDD